MWLCPLGALLSLPDACPSPGCLPLSSFRCIQGSSTCQEASTHLVLGSPLPLPPTLVTGCRCPPLVPRDCTTR